jgi:fibronectin-binding autotransporter adhesin
MYSGVIQDGTSATGLVHTGGEVTFLSAQTYTGGTTINGGTIILGTGGSLSNIGALTVNAGGTLGFSGSHSQTVGDLSGGGTIDLNSGGFNRSSLTVGTANSTTFAGSFIGSPLFGENFPGLIKQGSGTLTLTGHSSTIQATSIVAGTLRAGATGAFFGFLESTPARGSTSTISIRAPEDSPAAGMSRSVRQS